MLKIINNLEPFFEDCYRRINVREYAKIVNVSPPTASKLLSYYHAENILAKGTYRNYVLFYANKNDEDFIALSRIYWRCRLEELILMFEKELADPTIVLFGSLSKAEATPDSDIDLAVFAERRELDTSAFEKRFKRKIQVVWFKSMKDVRNIELANNIINGLVLRGRLSI